MEKVVKCTNSKCGQYFMHTKEGIKCPFCKTEYREVEGKTKEATRTQKKSFKIWGKN